jgi:alpha-tubulin suppressor-like RCC1 family protein
MAENVSQIDDRRHALPPPKKSHPISFANISKQELAKRDIFGRTILHVLVLTNRYDLLKRLFKNPESRLIIALTDWENGWNCLHYAVFHKRLTCLKAIMECIKTLTIGSAANHGLLQEMLRCKDRNQQTPLQLLDNDAREFLWWPEYINESSEFHLKFRYELINEDVSAPPRPRQSPTYRSHDWWDDARGGSDLFVLGANFNNNLGVGDSKDRNNPTRVMGEAFRIDDVDAQQLYKPRIKRHVISKYHSLVVTEAGEVFACGIGTKGRLGHGFDNMRNIYSFQRIDGEVGHIIAIDASSNHSLVLNTHGELYGWGLNSYSQLGLLSSTTSTTSSSTKRAIAEVFEPMPTQILTGDLKRLDGQLKGVAVSKVHSLVYTRHEMFSWGLCLGQMGVSPDSQSSPGEHRLNGILYKGNIQPTPKRIAMKDEIKLVGTCESCTCVVTTKSDIHIYYQYQHLKLPKISMAAGKVDNQFKFFKPAVLTQLVAIKKLRVKRHDLILFLLDNGDVVRLDDPTNAKYVTVWKARNNAMIAIDFDIGSDGSIVVCTKNGSVFVKLSVDAAHGSTSGPVRKCSMSESSLGVPSKFNKFVKLDNLNKIVRVSCDEQFESFGFIRDEVDMMPMKLRKNSLVNDFMHLESFREVDLYRKQDELFKFEGPGNSYITDFLFSHHKRVNKRSNLILNVLAHEEDVLDEEDDEDHAGEDRQMTQDILDTYHQAHRDRFSLRHLRIKNGSTYQSVSKLERFKLSEDLKLASPRCFLYFKTNIDRVKGVSMRLSGDDGDISIPVHDHILRARSTFFANAVEQDADAEFVFEGLAAHYNSTRREILFTHKPNLKSLVIFVHFLYTNDTLNIWDDYTSGPKYPAEMKVIRDDFTKLTGLFAIADIYGNLTRNDAYLKKIVTLVDDDGADLEVHLSDGSIRCHSTILQARSAFFETMLSDRWDLASAKSLEFEDISKSQFEIILRHVYGVSDLQLFDVLIRACQTHDQFVNELLDLIEIADGMLLFDLKLLCELAIKDLITLDNVLVLVQHSDVLLSKKLFLSCCWLIYNNLEVLLLDPTFKDLNLEILRNIEKQLLLLSRCKDRLVVQAERTNFVSGGLSKLKDDWFESNSTQLVSSFLNNVDDFNGNFLAGKKAFAPLIDLRRDKKKRSVSLDKPKGVGTDNAPLSFVNSANALAELTAFKNDIDGTHANSSAIEDDDNDNNFEEVSRRGRKPSVLLRRTLVNLGSPTNNEGNVVTRTAKNSFSEERRVSLPGLSPHSTWGSNVPLSTKEQPVLGVDTDRKTKVKVVLAPRLSQKERKRQLAQAKDSANLVISAPSTSKGAPWASLSTASSSTSSKWVGPKATTIFPTVGTKTTTPKLKSKTTEVTSSSRSSPSPSSPYLQQSTSSSSSLSSSTTTNVNGASLAAIMLQESMRIEMQQLKEKERLSLQEIQQEQEFERWWHEETLKFQYESKKSGPKPKTASRRTTK